MSIPRYTPLPYVSVDSIADLLVDNYGASIESQVIPPHYPHCLPTPSLGNPVSPVDIPARGNVPELIWARSVRAAPTSRFTFCY